jgi:hypothetical protein
MPGKGAELRIRTSFKEEHVLRHFEHRKGAVKMILEQAQKLHHPSVMMREGKIDTKPNEE